LNKIDVTEKPKCSFISTALVDKRGGRRESCGVLTGEEPNKNYDSKDLFPKNKYFIYFSNNV